MSLKSNGCIIFIGALTPEKILMTSKHALGAGGFGGNALSHAEAGERWLRKYLTAKGKSEAELARTLWDNNWTAISEVRLDFTPVHVHVLIFSSSVTIPSRNMSCPTPLNLLGFISTVSM